MESVSSQVNIGNIIPFGNYNWLILDVQMDKVLILTEKIIEERKYNEDTRDVTWETCTLRKYLNNKFLEKFSSNEQKRIEEIQVINNYNQWYGTNGGIDTIDKVILLSLEEVDKYFGNSGDYQNKIRKEYNNGQYVATRDSNNFSNNYDRGRMAWLENDAYWWWLRTPGKDSNYAAGVDIDGSVNVHGYCFHDRRVRTVKNDDCSYVHITYNDDIYNFGNFDIGGVRPAMWVRL